MATTTFSIRMDSELKDNLDALCESFGMTTSTAFNIFAKKVVKERRIPFEISDNKSTEEIRREAKTAFNNMRATSLRNGNCNMTLDEINEEIRQARMHIGR